MSGTAWTASWLGLPVTALTLAFLFSVVERTWAMLEADPNSPAPRP